MPEIIRADQLHGASLIPEEWEVNPQAEVADRLSVSEFYTQLDRDVVTLVDKERGIFALIEPQQEGDRDTAEMAAAEISLALDEITAEDDVLSGIRLAIGRANNAVNPSDGAMGRGVAITVARVYYDMSGRMNVAMGVVGQGSAENYGGRLSKDNYAPLTDGNAQELYLDGSENCLDDKIWWERGELQPTDNIVLTSPTAARYLTEEGRKKAAYQVTAEGVANSLLEEGDPHKNKAALAINVRDLRDPNAKSAVMFDEPDTWAPEWAQLMDAMKKENEHLYGNQDQQIVQRSERMLRPRRIRDKTFKHDGIRVIERRDDEAAFLAELAPKQMAEDDDDDAEAVRPSLAGALAALALAGAGSGSLRGILRRRKNRNLPVQ